VQPLPRPDADLLALAPPTGPERREALLREVSCDAVATTERSLAARWERSRRLGACSDGGDALEHAVVDARGVRAARERTGRIWREARPMLEDLASACARRDFVTLVCDANGVVTHALGGGGFADEARRLRLIEGATWGEELRGTNAIGTALAEERPTAVLGGAHYARVNAGLVCIAAPIRDPRGKVVGVLDVTSWAERAEQLDPSVVLTVARAIEEVLRARAYAGVGGGLGLVERLIERASGAAFLVEAPGRIVRANAAARAMGERRGSTAVLPPWRELIAAAGLAAPFEAAPDPVRVSRITAEPIQDANGELLALLVLVGDAPRRASNDSDANEASDPCRARGTVATLDEADAATLVGDFDAAHAFATSDEPRAADPFAAILGDDPALAEARNTSRRLAASDLPVLLLAETGSGKELFARAIHDASPRADGPYRAVNCGAIQRDLLLSELFGHAPGAFTGAARTGRDGLVAAADGGTLFLDEVAELSADAQVALLRVLEDGSYTRVGDTEPRHADIRIVAATCRDLLAQVATGTFRQDLFYRIGGARVDLPPLRARRDVDALIDALWNRVRLPDGTRPPRLSHAARSSLVAHAWPGNVRELESALAYAAVMAGEVATVEPEHLPPAVLAAGASASSTGGAAPGSSKGNGALDEARRRSLVEALRASGGNVSAAARKLGVARSTVYRLVRRYGLGE